MNFKEKFEEEKIWYKKIILVELCHLSQKKPRLVTTAKVLDLSLGTISENLRLAKLFHSNPKIMESCSNRKEALKYL